MTELMQNSRHEEECRRPERMVVPTDTDIYLGTVENAKDRKRKLENLGLLEWPACEGTYSMKFYRRMSNVGVVKKVLTKKD